MIVNREETERVRNECQLGGWGKVEVEMEALRLKRSVHQEVVARVKNKALS